MPDAGIIPMQSIGEEHEGQTVAVVGIVSHKKQLEDGRWSAWLQDGAAVEIFLDGETYERHAADLLAAAVLIRGRAEWLEASPGSWAKLLKIHVESVKPRDLLGIITEGFEESA